MLASQITAVVFVRICNKYTLYCNKFACLNGK